MNLGIDFGSTYTILSIYRNDHGTLEALEADSQNNVLVPSVISLRSSGKIDYGSYAKEKTGKRGIQTFKAFKMLLMEPDRNLLSRRGYDKEHSPEWALDKFMQSVIGKARDWASGLRYRSSPGRKTLTERSSGTEKALKSRSGTRMIS